MTDEERYNQELERYKKDAKRVTWENVVVTLEDAAQILQVNGWTRNKYEDPTTGGMCLSGAINYSCGGTVGVPIPRASITLACLDRYLNKSPVIWNDRVAGNRDEVVRMLQEASTFFAQHREGDARVWKHLGLWKDDDQTQ